MGSRHHPTIRCGFCEGPVGHRFPLDPASQIGCAACGNWASVTDVVASVDRYLTDQDGMAGAIAREGAPLRRRPLHRYRFVGHY